MIIINDLRKNLKSHGYIGDTSPVALAYLTFLSALRKEPVSLLLKGSSGAGKSYALQCAKRYVPEDAYSELHGLSDKALAYMGNEIDLRHKVLIIQEAAGFDKGKGQVLLRQLLTEGEINYVTVTNTQEKGLHATKTPAVQGPCGLIMTTTANNLHHEDENRMLSFQIDESPARVKEAMLAKARGLISEPTAGELEVWHQRYRELKAIGCEAVVPFADSIVEKIEYTHHRLMRDFPKVLTLIQTVALLHENERDRDADGNVVANFDDYEVVRELVEKPLSYGLNVSVSPEIRAVVEAVGQMENSAAEPVFGTDEGLKTLPSQKQIADFMGVDPATVSRNIYKAVKEEYLINHNPGQGKVGQIAVGGRELPSGRVLPLVEELGLDETEVEMTFEAAIEKLSPDFSHLRG